MAFRKIAGDLFKRRPEARPYGYIAALIVITFFILSGHDESLASMLPLLTLLLLCVLQLFLRTLVGWFVFVGLSLWYALAVALNSALQEGPSFDYVVFVACGVIPAVLLLAFGPFRRTDSPR